MTSQNIYGSTTGKKVKHHLPGDLLGVIAYLFSNHAMVSSHSYDCLALNVRSRFTLDAGYLDRQFL